MLMADVSIDSACEEINHNDVLCYIQNCFYNHPKVVIGNNLSALFKDDEIDAAKVWLFNFVDTLNTRPDGLPRRMRRQGDNKKKLDCEDLLALYNALDNAEIKLPLFTAANLKRLMPMATGELDICTLAAMMSDMQSQLINITSRLNSLEAHVKSEQNSVSSVIQSTHDEVRQAFGSVNVCLDSIESRLHDMSHQSPAVNIESLDANAAAVNTSSAHVQSTSQTMPTTVPPSDDKDLASSNTSNTSSWVDMAGGDWTTVSAPSKATKPTKPTRPVKVTGTRTNNAVTQPIKAVPRRNIVAAFVGRMSKDTKEEDLKLYLESAGVKDVICHKLKPKEGYKFTTSAFFVSCNVDSRDIFWDCSSWPEGAELRDWVFRS